MLKLLARLFLFLYDRSGAVRWVVVEHQYKRREPNHKAYSEHLERLERMYGKDRFNKFIREGLIRPHE